ncbi:MAG: glutamate--tRNA ligase [Bacteroidia bacterium]|nr:glutamate--tRNA ligase [Bacteroidia bacterium]
MSSIVTRYAPSPTGPQHIGGIRTALYSYLFGKKHGGEIILRIEDTDQNRYVPGAEEFIINSVNWCGFAFTQGVHVGGAHAPYRQSERSELYAKYADQLVKAGHAYIAFDTPAEIEAMKAHLSATGTVMPQYDASTRHLMKNSLTLAPEEVEAKIKAGEAYIVRFKVPENEDVKFYDLVRDWVNINSSQIDDKVLLKSDGLPTYHLANVVDDHEMQVTHVIRGEEWLPSAPLHLLMYRAFGWEDTMPAFAHLPLILKPDPSVLVQNKVRKKEMIVKLPSMYLEAHPEAGEAFQQKGEQFLQQVMRDPVTFQKGLKEDEKDKPEIADFKSWLRDQLYGKLSKRDKELHGIPVFPLTWTDPETGDVNVGYRELGYLPEAFLNYLALLGWNPGNDLELMTMDEMIENFSLEKVHKSPAKFDLDKLNHFQAHYLRNLSADRWLELLKPEVKAAGFDLPSDEYLLGVVDKMKERVTFVSEIPEKADYLFQAPHDFDQNMLSKGWNEEAMQMLRDLIGLYEKQESWTEMEIEEIFKTYIEENEIGIGKLMTPLRLAITGKSFGPGIFEISVLIGKNETLDRIKSALERLQPVG